MAPTLSLTTERQAESALRLRLCTLSVHEPQPSSGTDYQDRMSATTIHATWIATSRNGVTCCFMARRTRDDDAYSRYRRQPWSGRRLPMVALTSHDCPVDVQDNPKLCQCQSTCIGHIPQKERRTGERHRRPEEACISTHWWPYVDATLEDTNEAAASLANMLRFGALSACDAPRWRVQKVGFVLLQLESLIKDCHQSEARKNGNTPVSA